MHTDNCLCSGRVLPKLLLGALLALGACQSTESTTQPAAQPAAQAGAKRAQISNEVVTQAEVVAVEPTARIVTLRREDGSLLEVKAGEEVRNFAQIAVGDQLRVKYMETLSASLRPAGETAKPAAAVMAAGRAKPGAKPGAGAGYSISVRVKIESIDREREIVVYSLASGELVSRRIVTPEGREFVKGLKPGDTVQLDYTEVLAVSVEKL